MITLTVQYLAAMYVGLWLASAMKESKSST